MAAIFSPIQRDLKTLPNTPQQIHSVHPFDGIDGQVMWTYSTTSDCGMDALSHDTSESQNILTELLQQARLSQQGISTQSCKFIKPQTS